MICQYTVQLEDKKRKFKEQMSACNVLFFKKNSIVVEHTKQNVLECGAQIQRKQLTLWTSLWKSFPICNQTGTGCNKEEPCINLLCIQYSVMDIGDAGSSLNVEFILILLGVFPN